MKKTEIDPLSQLLQQGDPAAGRPEVRPAEDRRDSLLARCAADLSNAPHTVRNRKSILGQQHRYAPYALALGTASVLGVLIVLGMLSRPWQTASPVLPITQVTPKPSPSPMHPLLSPQKLASIPSTSRMQRAVKAPVYPVAASERSSIRRQRKKSQHRVYLTQATATPSPIQATAPTPTPVTPIPAEPVVEQIIIELDDTIMQPETPKPISVAIVMTDQSQTIVVSQATKSAPTR